MYRDTPARISSQGRAEATPRSCRSCLPGSVQRRSGGARESSAGVGSLRRVEPGAGAHVPTASRPPVEQLLRDGRATWRVGLARGGLDALGVPDGSSATSFSRVCCGGTGSRLPTMGRAFGSDLSRLSCIPEADDEAASRERNRERKSLRASVAQRGLIWRPSEREVLCAFGASPTWRAGGVICSQRCGVRADGSPRWRSVHYHESRDLTLIRIRVTRPDPHSHSRALAGLGELADLVLGERAGLPRFPPSSSASATHRRSCRWPCRSASRLSADRP